MSENLRSGLGDWSNSSRDDLTTVNEILTVVSDNSELLHGSLEVGCHLLLLVYLRLPSTRGSGVMGEIKVGFETEFANVVTTSLGKGRLDFTDIAASSGETSTLEEDFQEDLSVKL